MIYLKKGMINDIFTTLKELNINNFNIGTTFQDYLDGKYVLLSNEQELFLENNPNASKKEIWNKKLDILTPNIEEVRQQKLNEIIEYDNSSYVNIFYYGNLPFWLDKATRVGLMNSTTILQNAGEYNTTLWLGDVNVTLPCTSVIAMLNKLEIYALKCYNVTALHTNAVNNLLTIEEIQEYNIFADYPAKLYF